MKTIFKYPVPVNDSFILVLPEGAKILSVQVQKDQPCLWAIVDTAAEKVVQHFCLYGTGHPMPEDPGEFIGTFQLSEGSLVFHLFRG